MTHMTPINHDDCAPPAPGKVLKEKLLGRSQLTQRQLAQRLGVSEPRLTMIFQGRCAVSAEIALRVERAFGISPHHLMRARDEYELYEAQRLFSSILAELPSADEQERSRTDWVPGEMKVAA